jgi:hypothetical protein
MVEQAHIHNLACLRKVLCKFIVVGTWPYIPRGVVVAQSYGGSTFQQSLTYHQTYIDNGSREAACTNQHMVYDTVHAIEKKHIASLYRRIAQYRVEITVKIL